MQIKLPTDRCYYLASPAEPNCLLCWIPPSELVKLATQKRIHASVVVDYPLGLEVLVSADGFAETGLELGLSPQQIMQAYQQLRIGKDTDAHGAVLAEDVEALAREGPERKVDLFAPPADVVPHPPVMRPPRMTEGDDALIVLRQFVKEA